MTKETLKLFWRATWKYKKLLIASEAAATLFVIFNDILPPLIIGAVIDKLTSAQAEGFLFHDFSTLLWLYIGASIGHLVFGRLMFYPYNLYEPNVVRDLEVACFEKLQKHSLGFYADNFGGALVAKVNRFTSAYTQTLGSVIGSFNMVLRQFVFYLAVIAFISPAVALLFLIWTILFCLTVVYLHRRKMKYSRAAASAQTTVTARLADIIANTMTIRSFARIEEETRNFWQLSQERRNLRFLSWHKNDMIRAYKVFANAALAVGILAACIYFGVAGTMTVGSLVIIQLYLFRLVDQIWNFGKVMDTVEEALANAAEMTEVLLEPHEVRDPKKPEKPRITNGDLRLKSVTFSYESGSTKQQLFNGIDLSIPSGQKVGLVGPSGGGKTTLTKLLLRFMDIQKGEILIDGQNIAAITQDDLRRHISYVPQEPLLFHRTIRENIAYGSPDASKEEVVRVAKKAHAHEFIKDLPNQYETMVGERGVKLSGGQRQRVAIARAMLKDAPVIVLDEATSSLDSVSERLITSALDELMAGRTTIVVAHRLSTIRILDRILVLKEGKIIEDGTHDELLVAGGLYAQLWAHQTGEFIGEGQACNYNVNIV